MIPSSNSSGEEERDAQSLRRWFTAHHEDFQAVPHANRSFPVARNSILCATSSTNNPQPSRHGDFGDLSTSSLGQVKVPVAPAHIATHRDLRRFHRQKTQQGVALLTDVSQAAMFSAGIFLRDQTEIAGDLFAAVEALRFSEDQHESQGRQRTHRGMGHQALRFGAFLGLLLNRSRQLGDRRIDPVQDFQQIAPTTARPVRQRHGLQLLPSGFAPQLLLVAQTFGQRCRLQLVHDAGARLHHAMAMPEQLPQVSILSTRHPDLGKIIFQHQRQNMLRISGSQTVAAMEGTPTDGRQIYESCGHVVFPEDQAFWCPCQKCRPW